MGPVGPWPGRRAGVGRNPQPLGAAIEGLLRRSGVADLGRGGLSVRPVGADRGVRGAGRPSRPGGFTDGELLVIADSTAWATQVRLLRAQGLIRRLNSELGGGTVTGVKVRGPRCPRGSGANGGFATLAGHVTTYG